MHYTNIGYHHHQTLLLALSPSFIIQWGPELLVNSHINGTTIYVYASMVGSHDLIPFSPIRTMVPQVFLNRVSHHNWNTWLVESLTRFPQISIQCQRYLHQGIKHVQKIFQQRKIKHIIMKSDSGILIILYHVNWCNQNLSNKKSLVVKTLLYQQQVFYDKTIEKLTTASCFD